MDNAKQPIEVTIPGQPPCFSVMPIKDCPHTTQLHSDNLLKFLSDSIPLLDEYSKLKNVFELYECEGCKKPESQEIPYHPEYRGTPENWLCLTSLKVNCARYVRGHAAEHNKQTGHSLSFSFSDASFWCYSCDHYVTSKRLDRLRKVFGHIKHRKTVQTTKLGDDDALDQLIEAYNTHNLKQKGGNFSYADLVGGLKAGNFKKVVIVTGAGISVSAGIPDFRSSGGLYEELGKKFGCSTPEQLMTLSKFLEQPEIFYSIMKEFMRHEVNISILFLQVANLIVDQANRYPQIFQIIK